MSKQVRDIFVIMPFTATPARGKADLSAFFETNLKERIEKHEGFMYQYRVSRSDDSFDIGKKIVRDIYTADLVFCDLSGEHANPNVMYELGLRLALTNKPVIMFRESHPNNKNIFDISVYHTKEYVVTRYRELEDFLISKITKLESGEEVFTSPVLDILSKEPSVVREIQRSSVIAQLESIHMSLGSLLRGIGGSLHYFLEALDSSLEVPESSNELLRFVQENKGALEPLDWSHFQFQPNLPPSLGAYLSFLPLRDVVAAWLSQLWNSVFNEYYARFFGTDFYWRFMSYHSVQNFVAETVIVRAALIDLLLYFNKATDAERAKELNDMLDHLKHFSDWDQDVVESFRKEI